MGERKKAATLSKFSTAKRLAAKGAPAVKTAASAETAALPEAMIRRLSELLKETDLSEIEVSMDKVRVRVKARDHAGAVYVNPAPAPMSGASSAKGTASTPVAASPVAEPVSDLHIVRSPFIGNFYRAPSPSSPSFVEQGQAITKGQPLCIVEAMKLMNEIESDISGTIEKIFVENGTPVDFNAPLFGIRK